MELKLKSISLSGIPEAIAKAEHYRYLNEPEEAESICRDILAVDAQNQAALRLLGMAITDQFTGQEPGRHAEALKHIEELTDPYERLYYTGIVQERWVKALLRAGRPAYSLEPLLREAMRCFEQAAEIRPPNKDTALLRWNRCVRLLENPSFQLAREVEEFEPYDSPPT